ncbi:MULTISPECIES: ABC-three component system protein [unclassified Methylobacterium]|uniref:ABC-three component system protein n=1 Tax=unclassified Methylobacterium TaxID=2615210 RepID=UPI00036DA836|nr:MULTISPECIES: ABC-three component system protein [unclassified Methylobacterium]SEG70573.1 hypothetical protein SAMN04488144_14819 [Methylobacterium sp. 190mf]
MLSTRDILEGFEIAAHPGAFVLGCYDTRITLYSQQVRALQLAHAMNAEHFLRAGVRVAVVGGGAAGVTVAAALALHDGVIVNLYETSRELVPLQLGSHRRRIDPHIYEWPRLSADHPRAELPILDWRSGTAADVRRDILLEFDEIRAWVGERLRIHLRHRVKTIVPRGQYFDVGAVRQSDAGDTEPVPITVDYVVLAIGFGVEPPNPVPNIPTESYWADASVPGPVVGTDPNPRFLVSGNGDGGLIDFVAAASAHFDHWSFVEAITRYPDIECLSADLLVIDEEARAADAEGRGFDFVQAYDDRIGARVEAIGLVDEVERLLRPGVQLTLQTRGAQPMMVRTATLNRLAAYLVIKACRRHNGRTFRHLVSRDVAASASPVGGPTSALALDCDGERVVVDRLIARRGPDKAAVRAPFAALLSSYDAQHGDWVQLIATDAIAPTLPDGTHAHFAGLAQAARLPLPRYRQAELAAAAPLHVRLAARAASIRWSGDVGIEGAVQVWADDARSLYVQTDLVPTDLGSLSQAVARLAMHTERCVLSVNHAHWRRMLDALTVSSRHADGFVAPRVEIARIEASIRNAVELEAGEMAQLLDRAMDRWVLDRIDEHLRPFVARGTDPGSVVRMNAAEDLRRGMGEVWGAWRDLFAADADLLSRFLQMAICAQDVEDLAGEARAIVGPRTLKSLIRATGAALAVATGWGTIAPSIGRPGNLTHGRSLGNRQGHACAAAMIEGEPTALAAARFMWRTHFVLLPMEHGSVRAAMLADRPFNVTERGVPSLRDAEEAAAVILTLDDGFMTAARTGRAALATFLGEADASHFERLGRAIEVGAGAGA